MLRARPFFLVLVALAAPLCGTGPAAAQFIQPTQPQAQPQEPPCMKDFIPLRDDTEKKASAVRAASKRKATPQEACGLFNALLAAQDKLTKFVEANGTWCGIPPPVVKQIKDSQVHANAIRVKVCEIAAHPPAPAGPSLGDALGMGRIADPSNVKRGGGTFDTLTGTPLGSGSR